MTRVNGQNLGYRNSQKRLSGMGPYIRVKRQHQTVFLNVQPSDTLLSVKETIGSIFQMPPQNIQLWQGLNQV